MNPINNKTLVAALFAALAAAPALADKGGKGKDKHDRDHDRVVKVDRHDDHRRRHHARLDDDRHHGRHAARDCPPGLAKKDNGCMPPGLAKKDDHRHHDRVAVGRRIPAGAVYRVPPRVLHSLPVAPAGYRYAVVDDQVVLVSRRNDVVVEVIRSLIG